MQDLLIQAARAAGQDLTVSVLERNAPRVSIRAEELEGNVIGQSSFFVVDPIDGTAVFLRNTARNRLFSLYASLRHSPRL